MLSITKKNILLLNLIAVGIFLIYLYVVGGTRSGFVPAKRNVFGQIVIYNRVSHTFASREDNER